MSELIWIAFVSVAVLVYVVLFAVDRITSRLDVIAELLQHQNSDRR